MRLAVFGRHDDPLSKHTCALAAARGHEVLHLQGSEIAAGLPVALQDDGWMWNGTRVDDVDAYLLRQIPVEHAWLLPVTEQATSAEWYELGQAQSERTQFVRSLLAVLDGRGVPAVNSHSATHMSDDKALQLSLFRGAGLPLPQTIVSNFPAVLHAFVDAVGACVIKPSGGGAEAKPFDDEARARLHLVTSAPVIVQERVDGDDVRVTLVGDRVVSSVVVASSTLDYRSGAAYQRGDAVYTDVDLPADVEAATRKAAALCGHVLSGVDWKRTRDGRWAILEANSAPVYLDIEHKTGAPITLAIVEWLERASAAASV